MLRPGPSIFLTEPEAESYDGTRVRGILPIKSNIRELSTSRTLKVPDDRPPVSPGSPASQRTNDSQDSLASLREIMDMANVMKQATPDGQLLHVLREALVPTPSGQPTPGSDASDLVTRLSRLPALWRDTFFAMLEQAEAVQVTAGEWHAPP